MNIYEFIKVSHPERLIITHYFNPAYVMPLVEVVRGPETSDATVQDIRAFLEGAGKTVAVLNKIVAGFIINRFTSAICREACYMAQEGIASLEDIDAALVATYGPRLTFEGPSRLCDFIGLDIAAHVFENICPTLCNDSGIPTIISDAVAKGTLGVKSGEGLVGTYSDPEQAHSHRDAEIINMINAVAQVRKQSE